MKYVKILVAWVGLQVHGLKIRSKRMRVKDVEKMIIGSFKEVMKDRNYFYNSTVGPEYCHLTDEGAKAMIEMLNILLPRLVKAQADEDNERSKMLVLQELKK